MLCCLGRPSAKDENEDPSFAEVQKRLRERKEAKRAARRVEYEWQLAEEAAKNKAEEEENARKKAAINAELEALLAKKAELEELSNPMEPKPEPVKETVSSSGWGSFVVPIGWHIKGEYLVQDNKEPEAMKDFKYELEYK